MLKSKSKHLGGMSTSFVSSDAEEQVNRGGRVRRGSSAKTDKGKGKSVKMPMMPREKLTLFSEKEHVTTETAVMLPRLNEGEETHNDVDGDEFSGESAGVEEVPFAESDYDRKRKRDAGSVRNQFGNTQSGTSSKANVPISRAKATASFSIPPRVPARSKRNRRGGHCRTIDPEDVEEGMSEAESGRPQGRRNIYYRSNVESTVKELRELPLRQVHVEYLKKTPFWYLIYCALEISEADMERLKKPDSCIGHIIRRSNLQHRVRPRGFVFGDRVIMPKKSDLELIFGIRDGEVPIRFGAGSIKENDFVARCFPQKIENLRKKEGLGTYLLNKGIVHDAILARLLESDDDQEAAEDVARLVHIYVLSRFFMPNQNYVINWHVTEYVLDIDTMCDFDWSRLILDALLKALMTSSNLKTGCCTIFLLYWICEISTIIRPVGGVDIFPRFMKWDLSQLKDHMFTEDLDNAVETFITSLEPRDEELLILDSDTPQFSMILYNPLIHQKEEIPMEYDILPGDIAGEETSGNINMNEPASSVVDKGNAPAMSLNDACLARCNMIQGGGLATSSNTVVDTILPNMDSWDQFLCADVPSFELFSAVSAVGVNNMELTAEMNYQSFLFDIASKDEQLRKLQNDIGLLEESNHDLRGEVALMQTLHGTTSEKDVLRNHVKSLEDKVAELTQELRECANARGILARRIGAKDLEINALTIDSYKTSAKLRDELEKSHTLSAENVIYKKSDADQKTRISALILEKDFLVVEIETLKKTIYNYETDIVQQQPSPLMSSSPVIQPTSTSGQLLLTPSPGLPKSNRGGRL